MQAHIISYDKDVWLTLLTQSIRQNQMPQRTTLKEQNWALIEEHFPFPESARTEAWAQLDFKIAMD